MTAPCPQHSVVPRCAHEYSRAGYNLILLFPIIGLGVIDQDVPAPALLKFPQLYAVGQVGNRKRPRRRRSGRSIGRHAVPPHKARKAPRAATASAPGRRRTDRYGYTAGECS